MMDRRNWPWRRMMSRNTRLIMPPRAPAADTQNHTSATAFPPGNSSFSLETSTDKRASPSLETGSARQALPLPGAGNPNMLEKRRHTSLLENAEAFDALAMEEDTELQAKILAEKLEDAEKNLLGQEAIVKQHAKVAEEAVSGWEKSEAEALSLKQELAMSLQQKSALDRRVAELEQNVKSSSMHAAELEEALKSSLKQLRQTQEDHQQQTQEADDRKTEEWGKMKAEMQEIEQHLRQCMLAAEARSCAMAKSLEERARAVTESQEAKTRAEMEAGLLQVKLESQATEMAAVRYELHVLTKELEIRNHENEYGKKAVDAAHKQHSEDVKKIAKLEAECQRLRDLLRRRLPTPAAIAQMKIEADKNEQRRRRRSFASSGLSIPSKNTKCIPDLAEKLHAVEEEANILRETLVKRSAELDSARLMCARTANKLSAAEEQLDSLQGTPRSARSTQNRAFDSFLVGSHAISEANSDILDDEVSCAESWASALISELDQLKKPNHLRDGYSLHSTSEHLFGTQEKSITTSDNEVQRPISGAQSLPSQQDLSVLRALAGKDVQLQSANLMCKNAMAMLATTEAKLGGTWTSENPRSAVDDSVNSVGEAHGIMSKLNRILDDICIAAASVGDATDDDHSDNGKHTSCISAAGADAAVLKDLDDSKEQIEKQAKTINELRNQTTMLETMQTELQLQLQVKEEELKQVRSELVDAFHQVEELKAAEINLRSRQEKVLAEEEAKRGELQAQIESKQNEMTELQNNVASLGVELSDLRQKHDAAVAKCEELEKKLQSYADTDHSIAVSCKFDEDLALRVKKEREVAAAKEKLAECQRTILVLGKQLSEISSPSSASFDSAIALQYGILDTNQYQDGDHALKVPARSHQPKQLAYNSVTPHDNGADFTATHLNTCNSDLGARQPLANGMLSKPRRIHSDLSYRTGFKNSTVGGMFSVAEHLQMDDGMSSLYDSRTESAATSPSSQHTSPSDIIQAHRSQYEHRIGSGVRSSLAKSLEFPVVPPSTGDGNAQMDERKSQLCVVPSTKKGSKSLSRFFGRSKK